MLLTTVLALFCSAVIIYLALEKFETIKLAHHFPGPRSFPIIGNAWYFLKPEERLRNMIRLQKEFGNRVLLSGGSLKGMSLFHPDDVQKILTSKEINKSSFYDLLFSGWLGTSLFYAKGIT
ncbi:unnamed protein product [Allacma fusca]|uniref:Cytochrome P450 n=1 Tax=Allacma fusca TaxID=39272 RepID=A0A8J2NYS8_9HEXA|nr:unnamed protein product [Allacma fusca]